MNEIDELKQCIITFIKRINLTLQNNEAIYNNIINLDFSKIESLFKRRGYSLTELYKQKELFDDLITNILKIKKFNADILENLKQDDLSIQYLTLLNSELQSMSQYFNTEEQINYINSNFKQLENPSIDFQVENSLYNLLVELISENANLDIVYMQKISHLRAFELVKDTGTNENVVIIGANGSGKSSFSRNISTVLGKSIVIISAQKIFQYQRLQNIPIDDNTLNEVRNFQQSEKMCKDSDFAYSLQNDMQHLIQALISNYIQTSTQFYENRNKQNPNQNIITILEQVFKLWHEIIPHRELFYDNKGNIKVKGADCEEYDFIQLSDGEKAVFYYASHILLARENSYIIIDEPENHLNFAVVNKMWNILEQQRHDCVFMYLTHNINFASSRVNARKLWMKSYDHSKISWNIVRLQNENTLPESLYMELLGSQQKILFCEGDDNSSYDCKLYTALFLDFTIKPVKGHLQVIQSVRAFNHSFDVHGNMAIGIIDRDFHDEDEINVWKNDKIFSLPVCEIENIFLDEKLIGEAIKRFLPECNDLNSIKDLLFSYFQKTIETQAIIYARDKANSILAGSLLKGKNDISKLTDAITDISTKVNLQKLYEEKKSILENINNTKDYTQLIVKSNSKGLCAELNKIIVQDYKERMILLIREREDLQQYLKDKYFSEIDF